MEAALSGLEAGTNAPDFSLTRALGEDPVTLSEHRGEPVVLMFVPLAFSGVCTKEFCHVAENWGVWGSMGAKVYGISIDSPFVNVKWAEDMGVPFPILSDFNKTAAAAYGVLREEIAGLRGVANRSVFVVDADGRVRYAWVSEDPHVLPPFDEVVAAVRALQ